MKKLLIVEGMTCGHCKMTVSNALKELGKVTNVVVDLESGRALVEASSDIDDDTLRDAVSGAGYRVTGVESK